MQGNQATEIGDIIWHFSCMTCLDASHCVFLIPFLRTGVTFKSCLFCKVQNLACNRSKQEALTGQLILAFRICRWLLESLINLRLKHARLYLLDVARVLLLLGSVQFAYSSTLDTLMRYASVLILFLVVVVRTRVTLKLPLIPHICILGYFKVLWCGSECEPRSRALKQVSTQRSFSFHCFKIFLQPKDSVLSRPFQRKGHVLGICKTVRSCISQCWWEEGSVQGPAQSVLAGVEVHGVLIKYLSQICPAEQSSPYIVTFLVVSCTIRPTGCGHLTFVLNCGCSNKSVSRLACQYFAGPACLVSWKPSSSHKCSILRLIVGTWKYYTISLPVGISILLMDKLNEMQR